MFTALSACVLPIGPEFEDPPAVPNYEPYFQGVFPDAERTHQLLPPDKFDIVLGDPNPTDQLTVRWIANYPPFVLNATRPILETTKPLSEPDPGGMPTVSFSSPGLTCADFPMAAERNLVAIVSDRGFLRPEQSTDGNLQYSYKNENPPTKSFVMVGWRITGCN
jgi:hypothetical protein